MAKVTQVKDTPAQQATVYNDGKTVVLDKRNVLAYLKSVIDKGFKASKTMTIKDGALISKCFSVLSGTAEDDLEPKTAYETLMRAVNNAHQDGAYDINDAAVLDKLITFIDLNFQEEFGVTDEVDI